MINQKKVRTMSKAAMLEKQNEEQLLRAKEYYRSDYISIQMLKNILRLTVVFLLGLLLWASYYYEWLIEKFNAMQIQGLLIGIFLLYLVWMGVGLLFTYLAAMKQYFHQQKLLKHYQALLQKLEEEEDIELLEVRDNRRRA